MEISKYDLSCTRYYIVMVIYTTQLLNDLVILINLKLIMYKLKKLDLTTTTLIWSYSTSEIV